MSLVEKIERATGVIYVTSDVDKDNRGDLILLHRKGKGVPIDNYVEPLSNIKKAMHEHRFSKRDTDEMSQLYMEAVSSAVRHGRDNIEIRHYNDGDNYVITVADGGNGFDLKSVPDATQPEYWQDGTEMVSGRGIDIMVTIADKVEYNQVGNKIRLTRIKNSPRPITQQASSKLPLQRQA